jgi:hypothetical protein
MQKRTRAIPLAIAAFLLLATPRARADGLSSASLQLQVLTRSCTADQQEHAFQVTNTGSTPIALADISIRYWPYDTTGLPLRAEVKKRGRLTGDDHYCNNQCCDGDHGDDSYGDDDDPDHVGDVDASTTTFSPACGPDPSHQANWEIDVTDAGGAFLAPGESWTDIRVRLHLDHYRTDFAPGEATWFSPCLTGATYASDPHFALYLKGNEVFANGIDSPSCRSPHGTQQLTGYFVPPISTAQVVGRVPPSTLIHLGLNLSVKDPHGLQAFVNRVSDPADPTFRQTLTPTAFTALYSPPRADYQAVIAWANSQNLSVKATYSDRLLVDVVGTVADIEHALYVNMVYGLRPDATQFFEPDRDPSVDLPVRLLGISGLNSFIVPRPAGGSGPGNQQASADLRNAFVPCSGLMGETQTVGILALLDYDDADLSFYQANILGSNVPVTRVGTPIPGVNSETIADLELVLAMAPRLDGVFVFEATLLGSTPTSADTNATLALIASPQYYNVKQISNSWEFPADSKTEQLYEQLAALGQSFVQSSGDSGAYRPPGPTTTEGFSLDSAFITLVGGTSLNMRGPGVLYLSEVVWAKSGEGQSAGGILDTIDPITGLPVAALPVYQQNIPNLIANGGSLSNRNSPDVSMPATNLVHEQGGTTTAFSGTSGSAPLWAGFMALVNQQTMASGLNTVFVNPSIYTIGKGNPAVYAQAFHDITVGSTECQQCTPVQPGYNAAPGYDLTTGWGTPRCALIDQLSCVTCTPSGPRMASPGGTCESLQTDPANCGACGSVCASGDVCVTGHCQPALTKVAVTTTTPTALTLDTRNIYWTDSTNLMSVPATGGPVTTVLGSGVVGSPTGARGIAVDAGAVYWVATRTLGQAPGDIYQTRVPVTSGSVSALLYPQATPGAPSNKWVGGLSSDYEELFWVSDAALWEAPLLSPLALPSSFGLVPAPGPSEFGGTLTVNDDYLYYGSTDPLFEIPVTKGLPGGVNVALADDPSATDVLSFSIISVNGTHAYFSVLGGPIQSVPIDPSGAPYLPQSLAATDPAVIASNFVVNFVVDETDAYVYGTLTSSPILGLYRVPLDGGQAVLIANAYADLLTIDSAAVYWASVPPSGPSDVNRLLK